MPTLLRAATGALAILLLAACSDGTGPREEFAGSIQLGPTPLVLDDGGSGWIRVTVRDRAGREIEPDGITWSSTDTTVAVVNPVGQVRSHQPGRTTVTARRGAATASVEVIVRPMAIRFAVVSGSGQEGYAGLRLPDPIRVRVTDRLGNSVPGVPVQFTTTGNGISETITVDSDAEGIAAFPWILGPTAGNHWGIVTVATLFGWQTVGATATALPPLLTTMLRDLDAFIPGWLRQMQEDAPRNPGNAAGYAAKIALLSDPALYGATLRNRRWVGDNVVSSDGRTLPILGVYAADALRGETQRSLAMVADGIPVLEAFMGVPYPTSLGAVRVWQGFVMGNSGGGGSLFMEDRASYEARTPSTRLPYDAIILHEVSHSWIGHEGLNQFLELYAYNVLGTGSTDATRWTYTRSWTPGSGANVGVHALLDVYQLIGRDAMADAYRALYPMNPRYGATMTDAMRQLFVDRAPAEHKAAVAAKMARVTIS